jgi:hypothetical protein
MEMLDKILYKFFGWIDNACEKIFSKIAGPRCKCKNKKK